MSSKCSLSCFWLHWRKKNTCRLHYQGPGKSRKTSFSAKMLLHTWTNIMKVTTSQTKIIQKAIPAERGRKPLLPCLYRRPLSNPSCMYSTDGSWLLVYHIQSYSSILDPSLHHYCSIDEHEQRNYHRHLNLSSWNIGLSPSQWTFPVFPRLRASAMPPLQWKLSSKLHSEKSSNQKDFHLQDHHWLLNHQEQGYIFQNVL